MAIITSTPTAAANFNFFVPFTMAVMVQPTPAGALPAGSWLVRHPQEQAQQPENQHHHKPGEEKNLIALRVAMVPVMMRL
jgi:hypothetical protein